MTEDIKNIIEESGLFDEMFYESKYPDILDLNIEPLEHYCEFGMIENRWPNEYFDPIWYREFYSDVKEAGLFPFIHYIQYGRAEHRFRNPMEYQEVKQIVASAFDIEFYKIQNPNLVENNIDLLDHYITKGWKLGIDPNPLFSVKSYLDENPDVKEKGIEPFYHWLSTGRSEGRGSRLSLYPAKELTEAEKAVEHLIDIKYYLKSYPDVAKNKMNPIVHYMRIGWREGRNPNKHFNTIHYILNNLDIVPMQLNPLYHFVKSGKANMPNFTPVDTVKKFLGDKIYHAMQDITFPKSIESAEKLFVIVVPEHNEMSGGIFSMFSIANVVRRLKSQHGYEVALMTRPNPSDITYCRQKNFPNSEDVFRFEQIERCAKLKELYLHLPEYTAPDFVENLKESTLNFLKSLDILDINLLNQNYELMPKKEDLFKVRELAHSLTQSVAHHSYYGQSFADRYDLPTLLLPAYTDLSAYNPSTFENKDNLIIYSLDDAPHREPVLTKLAEELPEYELVEIRGITFDQYMDLATRCKFSISFGEGFDGYVAQPIYQGGIGMTVYNEEYFPSEDFLQYENFFESEEDMIENIVDTIKSLSSDENRYTKLNKALVAEWDKLYSYDDYVKQIKKLINKEFELYPGAFSESPSSANYKTDLSATIVK